MKVSFSPDTLPKWLTGLKTPINQPTIRWLKPTNSYDNDVKDSRLMMLPKEARADAADSTEPLSSKTGSPVGTLSPF